MTHKGKVYVIDDDEAMRNSLDFLLGSANFQVTLFESARQFLDTLSAIEFGCVLSDVRMPVIDGIELLKRLKATRGDFARRDHDWTWGSSSRSRGHEAWRSRFS